MSEVARAIINGLLDDVHVLKAEAERLMGKVDRLAEMVERIEEYIKRFEEMEGEG